ncbi:hypothetical protein AOQ84DRAFT_387574 [Glonium stellatum]|uniref:DUF985 domain-containing protein n=1 Tax=Glonium stellatum TaxID=574774 RepID=A0A8E2F575_9PEZI|nr:hypothetical protein AOQ84DRAFT_387574 [Glonium stellatum]
MSSIPGFTNTPSLGFTPSTSESPKTQAIIKTLNLQPHLEGGYFVETDRDFRTVPNPFPDSAQDSPTRSASTTIYYLLTAKSPVGHFHRNKGRTVHTLHKGRGWYVIIHADEVKQQGQKPRIEAFRVGQDVEGGEKLQWIVEGGKYKATFVVPEESGVTGDEMLLISETVVPGFDFADHNFMKTETLHELVTPEQVKELAWLLLENKKD